MGSGFAKKKKEARLLQEKFQKMQEEMKTQLFQGESGSGLVSVQLNGEGDLIDIKIKKDCIDPEEPEVLEDLVKSAFKQAREEISKQEPHLGLGSFGF